MITEPELAEKSRLFRYLFYLSSGCRLTSFRSWAEQGEPNPFVAKSYKAVRTERVEFVDIFGDVLK